MFLAEKRAAQAKVDRAAAVAAQYRTTTPNRTTEVEVVAVIQVALDACRDTVGELRRIRDRPPGDSPHNPSRPDETSTPTKSDHAPIDLALRTLEQAAAALALAAAAGTPKADDQKSR